MALEGQGTHSLAPLVNPALGSDFGSGKDLGGLPL
jgi:hypothetical protein